MGAIHLANQVGMTYDMILKAMLYGLYFKARDEDGNIFKPDFVLLESLAKEFEMTLIKNLGFDTEADNFVIGELKRLYMLNQQL